VAVGFPPLDLGGGLSLLDLELEVHAGAALVDPGAGTAPLRSMPCTLARLEVTAAGPLPGADDFDGILASALFRAGWPAPGVDGLAFSASTGDAAPRCAWRRPSDLARELLESAAQARARGESDAALRLALAGHAALGAGLTAEGESALRSAIDLGLGRDDSREAWAALVTLSRARGDPGAERRALAGLVPAAPTGERPALLLRLSALDAGAGDAAAARTHAEEARNLAPRDPQAVGACLDLARSAGDVPAVVDLLDRLSQLDPDRAGELLLERARLLARSGPALQADAGFKDALGRLPPSRPLADEHAAFRRTAAAPVGRLPWGEPLEAFAARTADPAEAPRALRDAALLAREQGDGASALRAARRAHERAGDPGFAGELLAGLLHAGGSVSEALDLHRTLLRDVGPTLEPAALAERLLALAELAEESGDRGLAIEALDRLLDLRPADADVVEWRFRVDPERSRALDRLAADADRLRSRRRRVRLLARAAAAARSEAHDAGREAALLRRAGEAAAGFPAAELEVARARLDAARAAAAGPDAPPANGDELAAALLALAAAAEAAGDPAGAADARAEALDLAFRADPRALALPALLALEAAAAGLSDQPRASALARRLARAFLDAGDGAGADAALRRAIASAPDDDLAWAELEALALARGDAGAPVFAELLAARSLRASGPARAELLVALARVQRGALGDPEGALRSIRSALLAAPGDPSAEAELHRMLAATGRVGDLGQALLERAVREADPDERARLRLRAAEVLTDAGDDATRAQAVPALLAVLAEPPPGRAILLEAAARLASLGRGEEGAPYLVALCRSDPFDGGAARALAQVLDAAPLLRARAFLEVAGTAPAGPTRAGHLRDAGAALAEAGQADRLREVTRATFEAWPVDDRAFRAALSDAAGDVDATDAILATRAGAVVEEAAACHRTRADLLLSAGRPGPAARAYESCLASDPNDGGALVGLAEARAAAGDVPGALAAARRAAELAAAEGRPADRRRALELGSRMAAGLEDRSEDAAALLEALALVRIEEGKDDPEVRRLATRAAAALEVTGEELRAAALLSRAGVPSGAEELDLSLELEPTEVPPGGGTSGKAPSIADLLRPLLASARTLAESGELGAAYARLKLAREIDPDHLDLTLMLARVAEKLGNLEEAVSLGEAHADALALTDRLSAAVRYRELADTARSRLAEPDRATALLEKAAALEPGDPATEEALASLRASRRGQALELLATSLATLRDRPADAEAARAVAVLSRELGAGEPEAGMRAARAERAAVAYALSRFAQRLGPADRPLDLASPIAPEIRARVALPGADGPTARLVALLAPYLEPLFPVDLSRHGVGPADRLASGSAPAVHRAVDAATRALDGRALALFAGKRPGLHGVLENTRPPSVILGADAAALPPGALAFLAARSVALAGSGHALLGKFAPRDVVILCELAARFAGGEPPGRGLPLDRAGAFLSALERAVPLTTRDLVRELGPASAEELGVLLPGPFVAAIEGMAARLALLHCGDLHGALTVLSRLQRAGAVPPPDPVAALDRPDLADLARFALSDAYLELRGMLLGWP
jgi:hypothetical protein